jgi:hypothetical protein
VKTYHDVAREYAYHPEPKCADADGKPCEKPTTGLLQRQHVHIDLIAEAGISKPALQDLRAGRSRPHAKNLEVLIRALRKLGLI